jgi:endonuclease G
MRQRKACFLGLLLSFSAHAAGASSDLSPERIPGNTFLSKTTLKISYSPRHKQASWVYYPLGPEQLKNCVKRSGSFLPDPRLSREDSAQLSDYSGSGFDKGHLSPAADNRWSDAAMKESFHLSNISPQPPMFNQHIWAKLEGLVRAWGMEGEGLVVTTGPILENNLPTIGNGKVSTPRAYYKVLFNEARKKAIAFLLPVDAHGNYQQYALPVSVLEERTGMNFHRGLKNSQAEREMDISDWDFEAKFKAPPCGGKEDLSLRLANPFALP